MSISFDPKPTPARARRNGRFLAFGFTLVELMVTVVIAVILAAIAIPDLSDFVTREMVRTEAEALATTLTAARNEAIRSDSVITVCAANFSGTNASTNVKTPNCRTSTPSDWSKGWVSFVDSNFDQRNTDDTNTRNVHLPPTRPITIVSADFTRPDATNPATTSASHAITFTPSGRTLSGSGTLTLSASSTKRLFTVTITVSPSGMVGLGSVVNQARP